jgi:hypothetical protein
VDDEESDGNNESHIVSDKRPPIHFNHEEEAAEALQRAQAIAQCHGSQHHSSPDSHFSSHPLYEAAQQNMNMYCIDVPVSLRVRFLAMCGALTDPHTSI